MEQWQPGHKLNNRPYKIEKELGVGGFGITYKAWHLALDVPVVIKTPNSKLQKDINYPKYIENFHKEGKQLAKLGLNPHPNIVRVSDLFKEDHLPCIVMDFVPGESLYELIKTQGALGEAKALEYIRQIGSALEVCHSHGIIHRDVHPDNILIRNDNKKAVLIDFGISAHTQTSRNTHSGNRSFAPWEQIAYWEKENSKTCQVDIYTLAASLYFLVTGEMPTECLARKYNNSKLIEPKKLNPSLSDRVNQAILTGMEVYPENRPRSMREWLDLLDRGSSKQDNSKGIASTLIQKNTTPALRTLLDHFFSVKIKRRSWLKYLGLTVATVGVTLIGKRLGENSSPEEPQEEQNSVSLPSPVENRENQLTLTEEEFDVITVNRQGIVIKKERVQAQYFRENLADGVNLEMAKIPGGTFMMGTEDREIERLVKIFERHEYTREKPQHQVTVKPFFMSKFQITQAQWKAIASLPEVERDFNPDPSKFKGDNRPVENVSWHDAVEFCQRLSAQTGKEYRLPSEAEWEYACRAINSPLNKGRLPFHFGKTITTDLGNYDGNSTYADEAKGKYWEETTPVGSFPPNAFGLYDMHGNVWEWCADTWHDDYEKAPTDGSVWTKGGNDNRSPLRGGSWNNFPDFCRSAYRRSDSRSLHDTIIGFRVVCDTIEELNKKEIKAS